MSKKNIQTNVEITPHKIQNLGDWIVNNSGPVIRYLMVKEMHYELSEEMNKTELSQDVENHPAVKQWLNLFGKGPIHASTNNAVENVFGRLLEFGFRAGDAVLDEKVMPYINNYFKKSNSEDKLLLPFLVKAGYSYVPEVREKLIKRLIALDNGCSRLPSDIYLSLNEMDETPKAWKNRPVFKPETNPCGISSAIPWIYDLHTISFCPDNIPVKERIIKKVLTFFMSKEFQDTPNMAVIWDKEKRTCYGCPILRLPGFYGFDENSFNPNTFIMIVEALSNIPAAVNFEWIKNSIDHLENFRTQRGTYKFPSSYLPEKETYYLYRGGCMSLCEDRKKRDAIEIESSFRMLRIKRNINNAL